MSYYPEDYLFDSTMFEEEISDGEESVREYEPYISYDEDMANFEDEEFFRAYNIDEDEYEDEYYVDEDCA
jgi:hypothetical protein